MKAYSNFATYGYISNNSNFYYIYSYYICEIIIDTPNEIIRFIYFRNPTPSQILGLHFDLARYGQLRYLNINTTFNSSIQINYRQTESAFWSMYLPTVIGYLVPTYPPVTEVRPVIWYTIFQVLIE